MPPNAKYRLFVATGDFCVLPHTNLVNAPLFILQQNLSTGQDVLEDEQIVFGCRVAMSKPTLTIVLTSCMAANSYFYSLATFWFGASSRGLSFGLHFDCCFGAAQCVRAETSNLTLLDFCNNYFCNILP